MISKTDLELSKALFESALPELYRFNAFRVLSLPVYATDRQIKDRVDELLGSLRLGIPIEDEGYLDFVPPPGENEVRNAVQRLRNPERRMVDELFWFWPQKSREYETDEALNALKNKNYNQARIIWINQARDAEGLDGIVSAHNLAILAHAEALDLELDHSRSKLNASDLKRKQELWQDAYRWWNSCLDRNDLLVAWLEKRIIDLNYNNLKAESAHSLKNTIPGALLNINILLAITASEKNEPLQADQNILLIKNNNSLIDNFAERALRDTIRSMDDYIKKISESSEDEIKQNPDHGEQIALNLINKTKTRLELMDNLLSPKNAIREGAHDKVANSIINILITFATKTQNWLVSLDLLKRAKLIAEGGEAIQRATSEITTVSNILEASKRFAPGTITLPPSPPPVDRVNIYRNVGGFIGAGGGLALAVIMGYGWLLGLLVVVAGYKLGRWIAGKAAA